MDLLEQLETELETKQQQKTLLLQQIDRNYDESYAQVTTRLLPALEAYKKSSDEMWELLQVWVGFFESLETQKQYKIPPLPSPSVQQHESVAQMISELRINQSGVNVFGFSDPKVFNLTRSKVQVEDEDSEMQDSILINRRREKPSIEFSTESTLPKMVESHASSGIDQMPVLNYRLESESDESSVELEMPELQSQRLPIFTPKTIRKKIRNIAGTPAIMRQILEAVESSSEDEEEKSFITRVNAYAAQHKDTFIDRLKNS